MDLKKLLVKTCEIFDKLRIRYVLIGGYAGIIYGSPYTTADIDFVVIANDVKLDLVDNLKKRAEEEGLMKRLSWLIKKLKKE